MGALDLEGSMQENGNDLENRDGCGTETTTQQEAGPPRKKRVAGVRLRPGFAPEHFDAGDLELRDGEWVVVETSHGPEVGQVAGRVIPLLLESSLPKVVRIASTEEIKAYGANLDREKRAWEICQELIGNHNLVMKLVRVESFFDGSKIIFYYSADGRVDFRELVKDLVKALHTRIEMRQIGIRHEAKMVGGIGSCGREICCAGFMKTFAPVSIKMAKVQNLPLNPNKISGLCGRLLCCITYEYETYADGSMEAWAASHAQANDVPEEEVEEETLFELPKLSGSPYAPHPEVQEGGEEEASHEDEDASGKEGSKQRRSGSGKKEARQEQKKGQRSRRSGSRRRRGGRPKQKGENGGEERPQGAKQQFTKNRRGRRKRDNHGDGRKQ